MFGLIPLLFYGPSILSIALRAYHRSSLYPPRMLGPTIRQGTPGQHYLCRDPYSLHKEWRGPAWMEKIRFEPGKGREWNALLLIDCSTTGRGCWLYSGLTGTEQPYNSMGFLRDSKYRMHAD
jgi:hypothetical protein